MSKPPRGGMPNQNDVGYNPNLAAIDTASDHNLSQLYSSPSYPENSSGSPPPPPAHRVIKPGMHPQSNFSRMQEQRQYGGVTSQQSNYNDIPLEDTHSRKSPITQPLVDREMSPSPPMHPGMPALPQTSRSPFQDSTHPYEPPQSQQDPYHHQDDYNGHHNYVPAVGGAAVGMGVGAAALDARNGAPQFSPPVNIGMYAHHGSATDSPDHGFDGTGQYRNGVHSQGSYGSTEPLANSASPPALGALQHYPDSYHPYSDHTPSPSRLAVPYMDNPAGMNSRSHDSVNNMAYVDPNAIVDDGYDDGFGGPNSKHGSTIFNKSKNNSVNAVPLAGAAAIGAGAAGAGITHHASQNGKYEPVGASSNLAYIDPAVEKPSGWLPEDKKKSSKWKKILFIVLGVCIILGIIGGVAGGILSTRKSNSNNASGGTTAAADDGKGDLSINSAEIQKLMNNPNLHKVFSGFAYTPFGAQYPECLTYPPSQNNITRDMAMMSQLTNVIRLYGTDCNQTEMVLHAIDRLQLTDMKIWLGVWLGNNDTTNARQVDQMWKILDKSGTKYVKGVVIGNEVLYRKDLTATQLGTYLTTTKSNLTAKGYNLPVATSDLGDNWTADMATEVDVVMSNIHPFFAGVNINTAASWTWSFWQSHDVAVTAGMTGKKHIISEFGWPSAGGNDCGTLTTQCATASSGAVASIPNMNILMNDWVCQALKNGTDYFWFEAFDEPWKIQYNTANQNWEDKWGLMDINRNLKKGVTIPTCGGQTAPAA